MRKAVLTLIALAIVLAVVVPCGAANYYQLAAWRNVAAQQNAQGDEPGGAGNYVMRVFVIDELGRPVKGARAWGYGNYFGDWKYSWLLTDERGQVDLDFAQQGNPCKVWVTDNVDGAPSTSDETPFFYNHDNHRSYYIIFVKRSAPGPLSIFDTSWCGDLVNQIHDCPRTASHSFVTPLCTVPPAFPHVRPYYTGNRTLGGTFYSVGQTFVANGDRAVTMCCEPYLGEGAFFRWSGQIFEGGPDGPPMGPMVNLRAQYITGDNRYILSYPLDQCALKPGNAYYVRFTATDGAPMGAWEITNHTLGDNGAWYDVDVYPNGQLYENDLPASYSVPRDLQAIVVTMNSNISSAGTVTGTITNADAGGGENDKIQEAVVTLNPGGKTIVTGKAGTYKSYNVAPGTYTMTVSAAGYQTQVVPGQVVTTGGTLTTDFALLKDPGAVDVTVVSASSGPILPGASGIPVTVTARNVDPTRDVFVDRAVPTFWLSGVDRSSYFTVAANAGNPTVIHAGETKTFSFTASCSPSTPTGTYAIQGKVYAFLNLQPNGSFEQDADILDYQGPSQWDWKSDDPVGVAVVSCQQTQAYKPVFATPWSTATRATYSCIQKWSTTGTSAKKQGVKIYLPTNGGAQMRLEVRLKAGAAEQYMSFTKGIPDAGYGGSNWKYYWSANTWYRIDATMDSATHRFSVDITPLVTGGTTAHVEGVPTASADSQFVWGQMSTDGTEEMQTREVHAQLLDATNAVLWSNDWLAVNGVLPTSSGWQKESGGVGSPWETMIQGVPWARSSWFHVNSAEKKEGARALDVYCAPVGGADSHLIMISTGSDVLKPRMAVKPSTTYKVSYWYKQGHYLPSPGYLRTWWENFDAGGNKYYYEPDTGIGYRPPFHWDQREAVSGGEWRYVNYSFTTQPDTSTAELLLRMDKRDNNPVVDIFTFDDFRMTEVNSYGDVTASAPGRLIVGQPTAEPGIGAAKQEQDGTLVQLSSIAVTGKPANVADKFYVEDATRESGILVDRTGCATDVALNDIITVVGTLDTVGGERCLTGIVITAKSSGTAPKALAMTSKALGGADLGYTPGVEGGIGLNNVGLLVTVFGSINAAGTNEFYLDDGSGVGDETGQGVRIIAPGMAVPGGVTHASVTGFCSIAIVGGKACAVVKPRWLSDIVWY